MMLQTIGELLPLAVGISISPLPLIAMIVLLMSPRARTSTPAFVVGWVAAIAAALVGFAFVSGLGLGGDGNAKFAVFARLGLGLALLYLAYREWRARPAPGEAGHLPHWLAAVQNMSPLPAAGLGFGIYAANPKNLTVGVSAGLAFGSARLSLKEATVVAIVYVAIAASTVVLPVVAYFIAEHRVRPWLDELKVWLTAHNAALMAVLLFVMAAVMLGKGIAALGS